MDNSKSYETNIDIDNDVREMLEALGWHIDAEESFESDLYAPERQWSYYLDVSRTLKSGRKFVCMIESKEDFENIRDESDCLECIDNFIEYKSAYEPFVDDNNDGVLEAVKEEFNYYDNYSESEKREINVVMKNLSNAITKILSMDWNERMELDYCLRRNMFSNNPWKK